MKLLEDNPFFHRKNFVKEPDNDLSVSEKICLGFVT